MIEKQQGASLPHTYPFVLLDRLLELDPGTSAIAVKNLTRDDPLLDADGCLPPVLLAETLAQAAGLAAFAAPEEMALVPGPWSLVDHCGSLAALEGAKPRAGDQEPGTSRNRPQVALVRIGRFRARARVGAGDQLQVRVQVRKVFSGSAMVRGVVRVNGRICAAGELVLQRASSAW